MTDEMRETIREICDDWLIEASEGDLSFLDERLRKEVVRLSKVWNMRRMCTQWRMSPEQVTKLIKDCEAS